MASHWRILNKGMVGIALHFNKITLVVLLGKLKGDTGWKQGLSVRRLQQSSREKTVVVWTREVAMEVTISGIILDKF